jgi:DUF4097 and DUF4098 domain-containing protein YvlB
MNPLPLLLALTPALNDSCQHEAARDLDVPRGGARALTIELAAADAEVEGVAGLAGIEVRGRACARSAEALADMSVEQRREGDRIVIVARESRHDHGWSIGTAAQGLRLTVRVPADMPVKISSASGDSRVKGVAALEIDSSSGDVVLSDIAGAVRLRLSSGDARGDHIGALQIEHVTSGDVTIRDVAGDARIGRIGSGDLRLSDVHGAVTVDAIGSGDITLSAVARDVSIGPVGSGDVRIDGVGGDLKLDSRRDDEDVRYRNVAGKVTFRD